MVWTIEPLALHRVLVPGPEVLFQRAFTEMVTLVIYAFVLRQAGQVCLVDTGLAPEHSELNRAIRLRKGAQSGFEAMADPLPMLLHARSLRPDCVLLTSFGPYTTGHLAAFDGATLVVSARGCADLLQPEEPALVHAPAPMARDRLLAGQRVHGSQEILPGLHFHEVGVHHPASCGRAGRHRAGSDRHLRPGVHRAQPAGGIGVGRRRTGIALACPCAHAGDAV
jgi:hypothetical protein